MRIVFVPGFTQTPASWDGVIAALPESATSAVMIPACASLEVTAATLAAEHGRAIWCGYSMGGRLALRVALDHPEVVDALVLVSATAGIREAEGRAQRIAADELLAQQVVRDGTAAFLESWLAQPMFATTRPDAPGLADRAQVPAATLAHDLRTLGTGTIEPMWERLRELTMPVVVVTGTLDAKFDAIGIELAAAIPRAKHVRIECGHAVPLERPVELAAVLHEALNAAATNTDNTI